MKICLLAPVPPYRGGIAKYCYSLAQELEKRHDLLLLSYRRQYPALLYGRKSQFEPESGVRSISKDFREISYDVDSASIRSWLETCRRIVAFRPDLVVLPWWVAYWAPMYIFLLHYLKRKGIKVVFLCINIFEHEDNPLKKLLTKLTLARVGSMIVHSGQEKMTALEINPAARVKMHLLPLFRYDAGTDCPRVDGGVQLLFFGFVRPYKGLDTLIRAIGLLKEHDITLTIAGEFWDGKAELLRQVGELGISGKVKIIDRYLSEDEMKGCFSGADLVVLPYKKTVTSGIIATAYGFGKPVLATDVGGFREVVKDGCTGKLVAPNDPQALADGIVWFINNRQMDFAKNIRQFTATAMSWHSLADLIEEFSAGH
jgi:glycosyltransferase involved in cell wall biosynthesis